MGQIRISDDVRPVSELKSKAAEIVRQVGETGRAVVLTRHGRGVAVVLSIEEYETLQDAIQRLHLIAALRQGERDIEDGRVVSHDDMRAKWLKGPRGDV